MMVSIYILWTAGDFIYFFYILEGFDLFISNFAHLCKTGIIRFSFLISPSKVLRLLFCCNCGFIGYQASFGREHLGI